MTIKDGLDTAGVVSTGGTIGRKHYVPERDATAVARVRSAGAILLGKTNTPELTLYYDTENLLYGRTRNPYDPTRSPGGSSGGAAAIVAACGATFDLGSDTGGSIRLPAHFCGVAGLKPTSGRVPGDGLDDSARLASGCADSDRADRAAGGRPVSDPPGDRGTGSAADAGAVPVPLRDPRRVRVARLRVAWYADNGIAPAGADVRAVVERAARWVAAAGAKVEAACPPAIEATATLYGRHFSTDGGAWVQRLLSRYGTARPFPFLRWAHALEDERASDWTDLLARVADVRSRMLEFMR